MSEIRDVAETILFGETLAAKLSPLRSLTDEAPGEGLAVPDTPGRPAALRRTERGVKERFPSLAELENDRVRGRLLHFLANHELLALELMALVLVRFPSAPAEARRGLVAIMADEQRHLRSYVERMEQLGVGFGEHDVGWSFWDALADVRSLDAFHAGMSVTLEQANLDHAAALVAAMTRLGDDVTRGILEVVLEDEVRHVRHGVARLERVRREAESQWDVWRRLAPRSLSPTQARGRVFHRDLRLRAGLEADFVERLEVEAATRPRRPAVWWFNPECEEELAGATGDASRTIRTALEALPLLLARDGDLVVTTRPVEPGVVAGLRRLGLARAAVVSSAEVTSREPAALRPWGAGPGAANFARSIGCGELLGWNDAMASAYRKSHAVRLEAEVRAHLAEGVDPRLATAGSCGVAAHSASDVAAHVSRLLAGGHREVVLKADFKTAGRLARRVSRDLDEDDRAWCARILAAHGAIVVEPWLDRVLDFSTHLTVSPAGVRFDGVVRFETDPRGAFLGAWASPSQRGLDREAARFVAGDGVVAPLVGLLRAFAEPAAASVAEAGFEGHVGVDSFVFREPSGKLAVRPLVEINPRTTMGRVALELGRRIARTEPGYWLVATRRRLERVAPRGLAALLAAHPPRIESIDGVPRLVAGLLPTTTTDQNAAVVTLLGVGEAALAISNG